MTSRRFIFRSLAQDVTHRLFRLRQRIEQMLSDYPDSVLDHVGNTPLIKLPQVSPRVRLLAKLESDNPSGSIKDRTVLYLIADALDQGRLTSGVTLLEASSGNTGISLAMMGAVLKQKVLILMPENVSVERRNLIRAYGAEVRLTPADLGTDGAIEAARALSMDSAYCWLAQHENDANILAHYDFTGAEISDQCPEVDVFISSSGTTGTLVGTSMRLKETNPDVKVISVWPKDWIMGLRRPEGKARPLIYQEEWIDHIIEISDTDAKEATRQLARQTGLLMGPSSGATWLAARHWISKQPEISRIRHVVVCFPDEGGRYLSTDTFERDVLDETRKEFS